MRTKQLPPPGGLGHSCHRRSGLYDQANDERRKNGGIDGGAAYGRNYPAGLSGAAVKKIPRLCVHRRGMVQVGLQSRRLFQNNFHQIFIRRFQMVANGLIQRIYEFSVYRVARIYHAKIQNQVAVRIGKVLERFVGHVVFID